MVVGILAFRMSRMSRTGRGGGDGLAGQAIVPLVRFKANLPRQPEMFALSFHCRPLSQESHNDESPYDLRVCRRCPAVRPTRHVFGRSSSRRRFYHRRSWSAAAHFRIHGKNVAASEVGKQFHRPQVRASTCPDLRPHQGQAAPAHFRRRARLCGLLLENLGTCLSQFSPARTSERVPVELHRRSV